MSVSGGPNPIVWPKMSAGQRLYVCKPHAQDWRDALRDHWDVQAGLAERPVWSVTPWTWRREDLLVTYMQTRPAMVVFLDKFYRGSRGAQSIPVDPVAFFKHGVPLGLISDRAAVDLTAVDGFLDARYGQAVINALQAEVVRDAGVFGDSRMSDLI